MGYYCVCQTTFQLQGSHHVSMISECVTKLATTTFSQQPELIIIIIAPIVTESVEVTLFAPTL